MFKLKWGNIILISMLSLSVVEIILANYKISMASIIRQAGFKQNTCYWETKIKYKPVEGKPFNYVAKQWLKNNKFFLESKDDNSGRTSVFIDNGDVKYAYFPENKQAMPWNERTESMFGKILDINLLSEMNKKRVKTNKVGQEKVLGKLCNIYEYNIKMESSLLAQPVTARVKEWFWIKEKIALKTKTQMPKHKIKMGYVSIPAPAATTWNIIEKIVIDQAISDKKFELPPNTEIVDMPDYSSPLGSTESPDSSGDNLEANPNIEKIPKEVKEVLQKLF